MAEPQTQPDVDALFPVKQAGGPSSVDELFPASVETERYRREQLHTSPIQDLLFSSDKVSVTHILDGFAQGAKHGWGADPAGLSPETTEHLRKIGLFNDFDKGERSLIKAANEALIRPAAVALDAQMRLLPTALGGVVGAVSTVSKPAGNVLEAGIQAAMDPALAATLSGMGAPGAVTAGALRLMEGPLARLAKARSLGVIGGGEAAWKGTAPVETAAIAAEAAGAEAKTAPAGMPVDLFEPRPGEPRPGIPEMAPAVPIAQDVTAKLIAAGRPAEEAQAAGKILQSHYEARAARFQGALGTAQDLYNEEGAQIVARGQGRAPAAAPAGGPSILPPTVARAEALKPPAAPVPESTALIGEPVQAMPAHSVATADGRSVDVTPVVVEAADLKASNDPGYDAALQPRNRDRAASQAQIKDISGNLDPKRLGGSAEADRGAAIVGPDGMVESGNGRIMAIRDAYAQNGDAAQRYRDWLAGQGVDVSKFKEPVLVRQRTTPFNPEERRAFTVSANQAATLTMSAPERAMADARLIGPDALGLLRNPDDLGAAANRDFVRAFVSKLPQAEQGMMADAGGATSAEGLTRIRNAVLARAYGNANILTRIAEATHTEVKSISNAMVSAAPRWARLRLDIEAGRVRPDIDLTPELLDAVARTADLRSKGGSLESLLAQQDAFNKMPDATEAWIRIFYDPSGRRAASSQRIADALNFYAEEGAKVSADKGLDLGMVPVTSRDIQRMAVERGAKNYGGQSDLLSERGGLGHGAGAEARSEEVQGRPTSEASGQPGIAGDGRNQSGQPGPATELEKTLFQITRGKIQIRDGAKPIITLFKDANASTFIHETGHQWLEELMGDAKHSAAPDALKADAQTVLDWLGVKAADDIKARHHEKFARGFEAYMMEGRAPTRALADVFARFRDWLIRIYETVARLRSPINDDVRGVFDRLVAANPEDRAAIQGLADVHAGDAAMIVPEQAHAAALTIRGERDMLAARHLPEEQDARLADIAARDERLSSGAHQPEQAAPQQGLVAAEEGRPAASADLGRSGTEALGGGDQSSGKPLTKEPVGPHDRYPDKAGNIRLDTLNTPEDLNAIIRQTAEENAGFMDVRGPISDAQVLDLADVAGVDPSYINTRKLGEAWTAPQIVALRRLLIQSAGAVREAMIAAATGSEAEILAYAEAKARHQMIQERVSSVTAEAGRALRAFQGKFMPGMADVKQLDAFLKDATGKTLFQMQEEARRGAALSTPQQVSKFVNEVDKPTWKDKLLELWINIILSGPQTHIANMISNSLVMLYRVPETAIAAGIGRVRSALGGDAERVMMGEAGARLWAIAQGAEDGIRAGWEVFKDGDKVDATTKLEARKYQAISGVKGSIIRTPGRMLAAEDQVFKGIAYRQELNALAYRQASTEGLNGEAFAARVADLIENPTEAMVTAAKENEVYQTFNQKLGKAGTAVQQFANSSALVKVVIPFIRTPVNIVKFAQERSLFGLFAKEVRENLSGANGAIARDTAIARMATGTAVSIWAVSKALDGTITGGGPTDPKKRAALYLTGWQPYSVKIGETYYSYGRLEPLGMLLGIAADLADVAGHSTEKENDNIAKLILASVAKNLISKTWLQGPSELIKAYTDPDRYGQRYIQRLAGSLVPSVVGQIARTSDPYMREARTVLDGIKARIPGMSETLLPRRDIWGEPIDQGGNLGPDLFSPIAESKINNDPVNRALIDLKVFPGRVPRKVRGVDLTDQQYDDMVRIGGRMAKMRLNNMVGIITNPNVPVFSRAEMVKNAIESSRETARSMIMMQNPDIIKSAVDAKVSKIRGTPAPAH